MKRLTVLCPPLNRHPPYSDNTLNPLPSDFTELFCEEVNLLNLLFLIKSRWVHRDRAEFDRKIKAEAASLASR